MFKRACSRRLEAQLNTLQKDGPAAWAALPEDELFAPAGFSSQQAEATASTSYSYWGSTFRAFFKNKLAVALLAALAAVVVFAFVQPLLPGQADPNLCAVDPATGIQYRNIAPGQQGFLWGSNSIGQDLWARIWAGARTSLTIAFFVAVIEAAVGITAGVLWGYVRGLDFLFTELYNIFDNIPTAIVLILISYVATPSIWTMILGMSIKGWIEMARFIRNQILIIRDRDYNIASRCIGTPTLRIVLRNLLPYLVSVIMLRMALTIPEAIGNEVFITYIGLGLSVETPSLGNLVNDGRKVQRGAAGGGVVIDAAAGDAAVRVQKAHKAFGEHAFAGAALAHKGQHFAPVKVQVYLPDGMQGAPAQPEPDLQPAHREDGVLGHKFLLIADGSWGRRRPRRRCRSGKRRW